MSAPEKLLTIRDLSVAFGQGAREVAHLLARGERSRWHRVDAVEIWHYYSGAPIELEMLARTAKAVERMTLGPDLAAGAQPQIIVPAHAWQSAHSLGEWTLVGCTVAPGFEFAGFEMAPEGWQPRPAA